MPTPYSVVRYAVTGSTQDDARDAYAGAPLLVIADAQTRGRGRSGSEWETAPRGVAVSLAFEPDWDVTDWPLLPLLAGLAAGRVIDCRLKWPNDLLVGRHKVGGILVEAGTGPVVVGMGINLWWPGAPPGVAAIHAAEPEQGAGEEVARAWADGLLEMAEIGAGHWPRSEYADRCDTLGARISWEPDGAGTAVDVADDGALVVRTDSGVVHLRSGDVRHIRSESPG